MPYGVIFDIDGTLVDTNDQPALGWYAAFRQHDLHLPIWQIHRHIGALLFREVVPVGHQKQKTLP
jgi:beta-phosphoglucomutase-like phosphatase (HAD superfamily)